VDTHARSREDALTGRHTAVACRYCGSCCNAAGYNTTSFVATAGASKTRITSKTSLSRAQTARAARGQWHESTQLVDCWFFENVNPDSSDTTMTRLFEMFNTRVVPPCADNTVPVTEEEFRAAIAQLVARGHATQVGTGPDATYIMALPNRKPAGTRSRSQPRKRRH
jgi:hypothetical protein